jgi:hypothetical protein
MGMKYNQHWEEWESRKEKRGNLYGEKSILIVMFLHEQQVENREEEHWSWSNNGG